MLLVFGDSGRSTGRSEDMDEVSVSVEDVVTPNASSCSIKGELVRSLVDKRTHPRYGSSSER